MKIFHQIFFIFLPFFLFNFILILFFFPTFCYLLFGFLVFFFARLIIFHRLLEKVATNRESQLLVGSPSDSHKVANVSALCYLFWLLLLFLLFFIISQRRRWGLGGLGVRKRVVFWGPSQLLCYALNLFFVCWCRN